MFSILQKRQISEQIQMILRMTNHPELPKGEEIQFSLHVDGAGSWSWADIKNNGAVLNPSVNPWNEAQGTSAKDQPSEPNKVKPLAQYLGEYLEHKKWIFATVNEQYDDIAIEFDTIDLRNNLEQALDAYESTEQVKIRIERV